MAINLLNPQPLYLQIANEIIAKIDNGEYKEGTKLGSQKELAEAYNVSPITLRKAQEYLINKGILFSRVGKGIYVGATSKSSRTATGKAIGFVLRDFNEALNKSFELAEDLISTNNLPNAFFAYADMRALGFKQAVLDAGLRVPLDVALVGFDDIERSQNKPVPLTTVRQPACEIGAVAFDLLLAQIKGMSVVNRKILEPELVIRESCGTGQQLNTSTKNM
ncbi:MAG TPA: GntR family transcriptional regulator [Calditrichaeota bacterium]|nr:GntR family transcriptional regulator [Calditrichota bacterium]